VLKKDILPSTNARIFLKKVVLQYCPILSLVFMRKVYHLLDNKIYVFGFWFTYLYIS